MIYLVVGRSLVEVSSIRKCIQFNFEKKCFVFDLTRTRHIFYTANRIYFFPINHQLYVLYSNLRQVFPLFLLTIQSFPHYSNFSREKLYLYLLILMAIIMMAIKRCVAFIQCIYNNWLFKVRCKSPYKVITLNNGHK